VLTDGRFELGLGAGHHRRARPDRRGAAERIVSRLDSLTVDDALDSPYLPVGTPDQIAEQLRERLERFGVTTWITFAERPGSEQRIDTLAPVIERLA